MLFCFFERRRRAASGRGTIALLATLALGSSACTSTESTETIDDSSSAEATLLLRTSEFVGETPCSAVPGAMRSYVATLIDHTNPDIPFTHPSSLPTPCSAGIRFDNVAAGRAYSVQIDGYEAFAEEIGPQGWVNAKGDINYNVLRSGQRQMQTTEGVLVEPRWMTACGEGEQPRTIAAATGATLITGCDPLTDTAPGSTVTALAIAPQDSLGSLHCAGTEAAGEIGIASFDLLPQNGLPALLGIPCQSEPFVQTYAGDSLAPGALIEFFVDARESQDGPVGWGATCTGQVASGLTVRAACSALSNRGSMRIDMAATLKLLGIECSGDIASYDAEMLAGSDLLSKSGLPCTQDITFGPLSPGDYTADLTIYTQDGAAIFQLACSGAVAPGRTATATCALP